MAVILLTDFLTWMPTLSLLLAVLTLLFTFITWPYSTWNQVGIAGPKPSLLFGNVRQMRKKGLSSALTEWANSYGSTFGIYFFRRPFLITSDLDIVKTVFVKETSNFMARPLFSIDGMLRRSLLQAEGQQWKRQRHIMTSMFSTGKIKLMNEYVRRCTKNLVAKVEELTVAQTPLDVKQIFGCFTFDVISGTGFGLDTNCLGGEDNSFINTIKTFFDREGQDPYELIANMFPTLTPSLEILRSKFSQRAKNIRSVISTLDAVIDEKKTETENARSDLLQQLLSSEVADETLREMSTEKGLSRDEIVSQGFVLFLAGYETTATLLQYLSYLLALNPDAQEKLHDEIISTLGDAEPNYENVTSMVYLDSCIHEALRLFPPVQMYGRKASRTTTVEGVTIGAGCSVLLPVVTIMKDERYFPFPDHFFPERFEKDAGKTIPAIVRDMPFGVGPRQCIGMRLALVEAKMATVAVLRKFKFVKIKDTPELSTRGGGSFIANPTTKILVGTEMR